MLDDCFSRIRNQDFFFENLVKFLSKYLMHSSLQGSRRNPRILFRNLYEIHQQKLTTNIEFYIIEHRLQNFNLNRIFKYFSIDD